MARLILDAHSLVAWLQQALINVIFTVKTCPTWSTVALVAIDEVLADGPVKARLRAALIHLHLTEISHKTWPAAACEIDSRPIHTCASVETQGEIQRRLQTNILVNVTVLPSETISTYAGVFIQ